jgi:tungstate transport system permease protein
MLYTVYECRTQFISVVLTGFGRSIAEVGAVQIVGGNIQYKTRIMTTAIMMQTNLGNFEFAVALGIILLLISFVVNIIAQRLMEGNRRD